MQFYGQWSPPVDRVLYENYFNGVKNGFFIESGAYDGVSLSCCKFFENQGWSGLNIEPAKNHYESLVKNRPKSINLNIGLSDKEEVLTFKNVVAKCSGAGNGSFQHSDEHMKELKNYGVTFEEYKIPTKTYKTVIEENGVHKVDLMCLDVEGFEFRVLNGMKGSNKLPSVMCIEYSYLGLKKLVEYMNGLGYTFDLISYNNAYFHHSSWKNKAGNFGATNKECAVKDGGIQWLELAEEFKR